MKPPSAAQKWDGNTWTDTLTGRVYRAKPIRFVMYYSGSVPTGEINLTDRPAAGAALYFRPEDKIEIQLRAKLGVVAFSREMKVEHWDGFDHQLHNIIVKGRFRDRSRRHPKKSYLISDGEIFRVRIECKDFEHAEVRARVIVQCQKLTRLT